MPYHPELSERLRSLVDKAIDHGIAVLKPGESPAPFLLAEGAGGNTITVLVNDSSGRSSRDWLPPAARLQSRHSRSTRT
jgi:hypothetical protein